MESAEWEAVLRHKRQLVAHINVGEVVHYIKEGIRNPPPGTQFSPLQVNQEVEEVVEFEDHHLKNLLDYLRRRPDGFSLLSAALLESRQGFLVDVLAKTKAQIPEVDSCPLYIPESRSEILHNIANMMQSTQCKINLYNEAKGVGTSCFMDQISQYLQENCYFTVYKIDLAYTPLILQRKHFLKFKNEIVAKEQAMKKYCVFCIDNINSELLDQLPKYQKHQKKFVSFCYANCENKLNISLITTSNQPIEGFLNINIEPLSREEMGQDIQRMFKKINDKELSDLVNAFPEQCNPLDCFLISTLYLLHHKHIDHVRPLIHRRSNSYRNDLFALVFKKLTKTQQEIVLSIYSLPCNAKLSVPSIFCLLNGSTRPPEEEQLQYLESQLIEITQLNLIIQDEDDYRYSMKDSNFFYNFRKFFNNSHHTKLLNFYLRGIHYYLDYTIKFIQDVNSLHDFSKAQQSEWEDTIPCISLVLDPFDRALELELLKKPKLCEEVYIKRIFCVEKLRNVALDIPNETLILAAEFLRSDYDTHHHKYAHIEDKARLLCLITELSFTPDCSSMDARENLKRAVYEIESLIKRTKSEELRVKYYLRILVPLGEIYVKERNFGQAQACFRECLKLKSDNKTVNWMLRKRLRNIQDLMTKQLPSEPIVSPNPPTEASSNHLIVANEVKFHREMGDSLYVCGDFTQAFNYYFEFWRKFHSLHMHLADQEYVLAIMGHLQLQKHPRLVHSQILEGINFYKESQQFHQRRKNQTSEFLKICILTANLLAGKKLDVKELCRELRNAQGHTKTEFFIRILHNDTDGRFLWRELTYNEKELITNRVKHAMVNHYHLEGHHYSMKLNQFRSADPTRFLEFPSTNIMENVDLFNPSVLYNQAELHLVVYIKIPTTRI